MGSQDLRNRFRRSRFGPAWILINLCVWVGGVGLVYGFLFGQPAAQFLPRLMAGFIVFGFVVSTLSEAGSAFINAQGYIKQFAFPKQVYLIRALVQYSLILGIGLIALFVVLALFGRFSILGVIYALPGIAIVIFTGFGHIAVSAYLGVRFRDYSHAMGSALQVAFLVTPIVFPSEILRDNGLQIVYKLNPLYYLIEVVRTPVLTNSLPGLEIIGPAVAYLVAVWAFAVLLAIRLDRRVVFLL